MRYAIVQVYRIDQLENVTVEEAIYHMQKLLGENIESDSVRRSLTNLRADSLRPSIDGIVNDLLIFYKS